MANEIVESGVSAGAASVTVREKQSKPLREQVEESLVRYFEMLGGEAGPLNLYEMVLAEMEIPLLDVVLQHTRWNRTKAAKLLGVSRGTLHKRLKRYGLV